MSASIAAPLTAAQGMRYGVHGLAANMGAASHMAFTAGLAEMDMLMIGISDLPDCGSAGSGNHSHFSARHNYVDPFSFFCRDTGR